MLPTFTIRFSSRSVAAVLLGAALAASPALAKSGGSGNAGGNGNGHAYGKSADATQDAGTTSNGNSASALGALNGFIHASPKALANASPKSEIGKAAVVYAGLLQNYLAPATGTTPPTLAQLASALSAAANKPLTPAIIEAVNAKLEATNPALAQSLPTYSGGPTALATAIYGAI